MEMWVAWPRVCSVGDLDSLEAYMVEVDGTWPEDHETRRPMSLAIHRGAIHWSLHPPWSLHPMESPPSPAPPLVTGEGSKTLDCAE